MVILRSYEDGSGVSLSHGFTLLQSFISSSSVVLSGFCSTCYRWNWDDLLICSVVDVKMVVVLFGVESVRPTNSI